jgi:phage gp29-like protein
MAEDKKDKAVLAAEVISPFAAKLGAFTEYMPNPDELLQDIGQTLEIYEKMKLDARISSLLDIRKADVLNYPYYLVPGDDTPQAQEISDFAGKTIKALNLYQEMKEFLSALDLGFSLSEVIWSLQDGKWRPVALKNRKAERFMFQPDGTPVLLNQGQKTPLDEPYKYIVHTHNSGAENPYGNAVLKQCYWPWIFKKAGWRFWLTAAEKFGVPTVLALFETDDEDKARERAKMLAEMLSGIQSDAAVALANVKEVTTLEVKGDLSSFKTLIEACDVQISYAITGQSLASGEGQYGTRAQAEVHEGQLDSLTGGDAKQLAYTLNKTLIAWIVELNYGPDAPKPILEFDTDDYASWEIVKDAIDRGVPISQSALYTKYNIPKPANDKDIFIISPDFRKADSSNSSNSSSSLNMSDGFFLRTRRR